MNWLQPIDIYCERLGPGFWAEPVNALTNLAILVAGTVGLVWSRRLPAEVSKAWSYSLSVLVIAIGIGSFLFHTFGQYWSMLADQLPILVFSLTFFGFVLTQLLKLSIVQTAAILTLYAGLGIWLKDLGADILNGSLAYANALLGLVITTALLGRLRHPLAGYLLAATIVFLLSLSMRTIDTVVCDRLAIGTHFLWHLLNAVVLLLLLRICTKPISASLQWHSRIGKVHDKRFL